MLRSTNSETPCQSSISVRNLPVNFDQADLKLFEHELERVIPTAELLHLEDVTLTSASMLFKGLKILPVSFPSYDYINTLGFKDKLTFLCKNYLLRFIFRDRERFDFDAICVTDIWSRAYFHWMTDALPRLFTIRNEVQNATLLLPYAYRHEDYIEPSLKPFSVKEVKYIRGSLLCKTLKVPTHTALAGNYNDRIIKAIRSLYTHYYLNKQNEQVLEKVYISRAKTDKRKIANENNVIKVLESYGFKTVYFEEHSFEQQVKMALNAKYLISNHGAGLTNMLFMKPGSCVFELRKKGDSNNNCYFSLASALDLKYYYQVCEAINPDDDVNMTDLIVDCQLLETNIVLML